MERYECYVKIYLHKQCMKLSNIPNTVGGIEICKKMINLWHCLFYTNLTLKSHVKHCADQLNTIW